MYFTDFGLWCLIAIGFGLMEGFMYHKADPNKSVGKDSFILNVFHKISFGIYKPNEHAIFNIVRSLVVVSFVYDKSLWVAIAMSVAFILIFPFMHDGMYYVTRYRLNRSIVEYKEGWLSDPSSTTTSIASFNAGVRVVAMIISLVIISFLTFFY